MKKNISLFALALVSVAFLAQTPANAQSIPTSNDLIAADGTPTASVAVEDSLAPLPSATSVSNGIPTPEAQETASTVSSEEPILSAQTETDPKRIPISPPAVVVDQPLVQDTFELPLNKTRPIELDGRVRDIIVGNPAIADVVVKSPTQVFMIGRSVGTTNVFLMDQGGSVIRTLDVVVEPDGSALEQVFASLLPGESIRARGVGDSIVLTGTASSDGVATQAQQLANQFVASPENVVNMISIGQEQQVLLRVRVAELAKTSIKDLSAAYRLLDPINIGAASLGLSAVNIGQFGGLGGGGGTITLLNENDYAATFHFLEQQGLARTLAEPNLLAVSGETASFLAGGEFPIPVAQDEDAVTVEFRQFGVSLAFLPVVLSPGRISLRVATEVSQVSSANAVQVSAGLGNAFTIPGLATRRANSVIELPSGGGIMIAGLLQNDIVSSVNGVPGLKDVPILGALFRSTSFQRQETELVILVSVLLAKTANPNDLALPTDGFAPSNDLDRYFVGRLQNIYVKRTPSGSSAQSPQGPIGYIID